jgi:choline kinase
VKVVIIAAGRGSRLGARTGDRPKTLLPFGGGTILSTIVGTFTAVGFEEFVIVAGYRAGAIVSYVEDGQGLGARIEVVENPDWRRGNGRSVLAAAPAVGDGPFLLSMSDHVVTPGALDLIARHPSERNLLLVDRRVEGVFDLPDATKVRVEGNAIAEIGKELPAYNAIDCGVFRLNRRFLTAMARRAARGEDSISDGVRELVLADEMEAVTMGPDQWWMDLDTPEAFRHAHRWVERLSLPGPDAG